MRVARYNSQKIYVLGQVNSPGAYPYDGRISVLDALGQHYTVIVPHTVGVSRAVEELRSRRTDPRLNALLDAAPSQAPGALVGV